MAFTKTTRPKTTAATLTISEMDRQARELLEGLKPLDQYRTDPAKLRKPAKTPAAPPRIAVDRNLHPYGLPEIPAGQRKVAGACGICGMTGNQERKRIATPGREWGLPQIKGPTDRVSIELCRDCEGRWDQGGDYYYEGRGTPANVGYAITKRLRDPRRGRPELIDWLPEPEVIPLERLLEFTFAGQVITARVEGRPDPTPPPIPFGFLDGGTMINRVKQRKKEKTT